MLLTLNSTYVDSFVIVLVIFFILVGVKKGFITRIYDVFSFFLALFLAYYLSGPASLIITIFDGSGYGQVLMKFMNQISVFIIVFVCLKIVFTCIGFLIKPLVNAIVSKILFINEFNKLLGGILGLIQGVFISFVCLLLALTPLFENGNNAIETSFISKMIMNIAPQTASSLSYASTMIFHQDDESMYDSFSQQKNVATFFYIIENLYESSLIDQDLARSCIHDYTSKVNQTTGIIEVNQEQYQTIYQSVITIFDQEEGKQLIERIICRQ